jgi:hypothetical protein
MPQIAAVPLLDRSKIGVAGGFIAEIGEPAGDDVPRGIGKLERLTEPVPVAMSGDTA